jgi:hypothetical protein
VFLRLKEITVAQALELPLRLQAAVAVVLLL